MSYVYRRHEAGSYGVGYITPEGGFEQESSHVKRPDAIARMRWLNGACGPEPGTTGQDAGCCCRCGGSAVTS